MFFSDPAVVTASREWVCVRPATYESTSEAEVLKSYFMGRRGNLENTVFALLDSNAKLLSMRAGRSPGMLYDGPAEFAAALTKHSADVKKSTKRALPRIDNLRLALNIAACDSLPLVVGYAADEKTRASLAKDLAKPAWDEAIAGNAHFVICDRKELEAFPDLESKAESKSGLLVVDPDDYGTTGEVLAKMKVGSKEAALTKELNAAIAKHEAIARDHRDHVRQGKRKGLEWESELESSDSKKRRR